MLKYFINPINCEFLKILIFYYFIQEIIINVLLEKNKYFFQILMKNTNKKCINRNFKKQY